MSPQYRGYRDLKVYQLAYSLALEIFEISKTFSGEEKYSRTDQIRRCSRSVPTNIAEAWRRRKYEKAFVSKLTDSATEESETEVWLDFCRDLKYISGDKYQYFFEKSTEVAEMLSSMIDHPERFCHKE
jgi:four helix bundle protein